MQESDILRFDDVQAHGLIDEDDADGDADTLSVGTTDVGSEEDRQIVQTELSRFRDAQGHSTHTDTIAVEELYHQELEEEERLVNIDPRRDDNNHAEAVLKFECRMVQRQVCVQDVAGGVRTVWRSLSCSDADDACSLRTRGALCGSLRIGEEVLVLDACPWSHAPGSSGWFQQIARVSRVLPSGAALLSIQHPDLKGIEVAIQMPHHPRTRLRQQACLAATTRQQRCEPPTPCTYPQADS